MPTKSYLITGRNLTVDNLDTATVMTVTLSNPRPLHTVTVSQDCGGGHGPAVCAPEQRAD